MMTINQTQTTYSKKQILKAPLSLYITVHPDNHGEEKQQLQALQQQRATLSQQQQTLQHQSKTISRQIGLAKRKNEDASELKSSMQLLSHNVKDCTRQLREIDEKILPYFQNILATSNSNEPHSPLSNYGKRDYIDSIKIDEITISQLSKLPSTWNDYVKQHPAGCIHHRSEWLAVLSNSYQHSCFFFAAFDGDKNIVGILSLVRLTSRLFGDLMVSMPYFQRGGTIADHPKIEQKLICMANKQAEKLSVSHIEYRDDIEHKNMPVQTHKVNMVLALPPNSDMLWQGFSSKLRAQIKRPQRENPETVIGHAELLNDFYTVYSRNMRDLGSPVHSKKFIANILKQFPNNSWLVVVTLKQKPVSVALLLADGDTMEIPLASTIRGVNHLSINMLLYWKILQFAISRGHRYFDFGRSTKDAGTYRFKYQWGAKPQTLYWHYWLSDGQALPRLNPSNPKFALLINIWKRLPIIIANLIGPMIVKNIP